MGLKCHCDLNKFWEWVYEELEHFHRDPVANLVIYSSFGIFFAAVSCALGAAAYGVDANPGEDGALLIISFVFAAVNMIVTAFGIMAGECHTPLLYSTFGALGFVGSFLELFAMCATFHVYVPIVRVEKTAGPIMGVIAACFHLLTLVCLLRGLRFSWYINSAFTRQDREMYAESKRTDTGADRLTKIIEVEGVDNEAFQGKGMVKSFQTKQQATTEENV
jgi:hypothetical protein